MVKFWGMEHKFSEILQNVEGHGEGENNIRECPGFAYDDSLKWVEGTHQRKGVVRKKHKMYEPLAKDLLEKNKDKKLWLELGAGPGCLSWYLRWLGVGVHTVTLDINKDAPNFSKYLDHNHFICYTDRPYQIQLEDQDVKFDMIISYEHFEHIPPIRLNTFLGNIKKHSHKDTIINCTCSNKKNRVDLSNLKPNVIIEDINNDYSDIKDGDFASHQSIFSREKWVEMFDENGFKVLEETYLNEENCPPNFTLENTMEFTLKLK